MKTKPTERLEKSLARVADERGVDQERLRRWVSFLALCGVLEKAVAQGILKSYYLKGGVAMELRYAAVARATKDLDLALDGDRAARMRSFESALKLGFDDFTFRLKPKAHHMDVVDTVRVEVAVQHRTRGWQTIDVDLGPAGSAEVDLVAPAVQGLVEMNLAVPPQVRCLGISEQVAQKLHACTAPGAQGRARDILDILLFDLLGKIEHARVRAAAERTFKERGTHVFPPAAEIPDAWREEVANLARQLAFPTDNADEIAERFRALLARIVES